MESAKENGAELTMQELKVIHLLLIHTEKKKKKNRRRTGCARTLLPEARHARIHSIR